MLFELFLLAVGAIMFIRPRWLGIRRQHEIDRRVEQLQADAAERYFEEQRSLEAYPARQVWVNRLLGGAIVFCALVSLALQR